jgi:ElaB/YqjD/DUF883 family membrane-anchored ribosome-binding protein
MKAQSIAFLCNAAGAIVEHSAVGHRARRTQAGEAMASIDQVIDDFAAVLNQADDLLRRAAGESGDTARDLRAEVTTLLQAAKARLQALEHQATDSVKAVAEAGDDYVHDKPWQAVGIAATVGLVLGVLLARR